MADSPKTMEEWYRRRKKRLKHSEKLEEEIEEIVTPEEIEKRKAEIQEKWTEKERLNALRPDWRPKPIIYDL